MHLRTELSVNKSLLTIDHKAPLLTLGSCFSEEMGSLLATNKFNVLPNLFGTAFNPFSIAGILKSIVTKSYSDPLPVCLDDVWLDYRFHSSLFGYSKNELYEKLQQNIQRAHQQLSSSPSPVVIVTLGTAWVYRLLENQAIVSNCHKQPSSLFQKELLSLNEYQEAMVSAFEQLFQTFPGCNIVLSLSPVRHMKDGLPENQVSKSILRILCHELSNLYPQVHYFPAYELVLDDLRDYRFYSKDLIHPNEQAVAYIWQNFRKAFFNQETEYTVHAWEKIRQQLMHKPFYEKSIAYKHFLQQTLQELETLNTRINVQQEINELQQLLQHHSS